MPKEVTSSINVSYYYYNNYFACELQERNITDFLSKCWERGAGWRGGKQQLMCRVEIIYIFLSIILDACILCRHKSLTDCDRLCDTGSEGQGYPSGPCCHSLFSEPTHEREEKRILLAVFSNSLSQPILGQFLSPG